MEQHYCLKHDNFTLGGKFIAEKYDFLSLKFYQCVNTTSYTTCKPQALIDQVLSIASFGVTIRNKYIDFSDYEQPIKPFIDTSKFWLI